jgi:hypothetical protein
MKLSIDPEFQALMSLLSAEEHAQLEDNLLAEGCRDAFAVWAGESPDRIWPSRREHATRPNMRPERCRFSL